jgi:7-carboxy-7-deazaguanine synthase
MTVLRDMVDVVSMDVKLPSATGLQPFWDEHRKFLEAARGRALFVKAVVTADTAQSDILTAVDLVARYDQTVPFILQPASGPTAPTPLQLIGWQNAALAHLADVRVIPQLHKVLCVP